MDEKIKLYGYPTSPYVMKVACYLHYKKLPFEFVPVNPIHSKEIRFTNQRQVPVLCIGQEWKKDSSLIGLWLDEKFPSSNPLITTANRKTVMPIDTWVSDSLIPARFRAAVDWPNPLHAMHNGWKLARAVHNATPLPLFVRWLWPILVCRAGFIRELVDQLDLSESSQVMHARLARELVMHLQGGPFLGGQLKPSLADLSAYPIVVSGHLMGMKGNSVYLQTPEIMDWCEALQTYMPANPLLVPDRLIERPLIAQTN